MANGIDVPSPAEGQPPVHFAVSYRQANKPNPTKRRVAPNVLARIAITVQHFELRNLAQFIRPGDLAAGWAALGFDPINPRWGQNKITNQEGEKALGGRNSGLPSLLSSKEDITMGLLHPHLVHTVQSPPLQAGSCQVCRSMKGEGDRGLVRGDRGVRVLREAPV
eukprot:scaffold9001_cov127-Isochrysis_galbana.AAC.4